MLLCEVSGFTPLLSRKLWIGALGSLPELTPPASRPSPYCSSSYFLSWQVLGDPINLEPLLGLQPGPELMTSWKGICLRWRRVSQGPPQLHPGLQSTETTRLTALSPEPASCPSSLCHPPPLATPCESHLHLGFPPSPERKCSLPAPSVPRTHPPHKEATSQSSAWLATGKQACRPPRAGPGFLQRVEGLLSWLCPPQIRPVVEGPLNRGEGGT